MKNTTHISMKKLIMILGAALLLGTSANAQTVHLSMDTIKAYKNDSVVMPVHITGFSNMGAITIHIQFDTTKLAWGRTMNWNSGLNGNIPLVHHSNGILGMSWIDVGGVSFNDGLLVELKFKLKGGKAPLTILTTTEFANPLGQIKVHTASNGLIYEGLTLHPDTMPMVCLGSSIELKPVPSGGIGPLSYQWATIPPSGFSSTMPTVVVSPSITSTYGVTVTDGIDLLDTVLEVNTHPNISPAAPTGMLPADSATQIFAPVNFTWSPSLHATHYELYIWRSDQTMPSSPTKGNITQISLSYNGALAEDHYYHWKIVAKNACYSTSSAVQTFKTRAKPNLHVTNVTTSQPVSGQPLTVTWTVTNDGLGPTVLPPGSNNWIDRIWLSPDFDLRVGEPVDDKLLGQYENVTILQPGESYVNTKTVQIPANLMGPYYLWVLTDMNDAYFFNNPVPVIPYNPPPYINASGQHGSGKISETNDVDNFFYTQLQFPVPPLADLYTSNMVTPSAIFSGQPATISFTTENRGTNITPSGVSWYDKIWLSPDSVFSLTSAVQLGQIKHSTPLAPDSAYTDSITVSIPNNIYGTYYFFVQNDATNQLFENIGESNNYQVSNPVTVIMTPPADLAVAIISNPDTFSVKEATLITWTVVNQGGAATLSNGHYDAVYISLLDTFNLQQSTKLYEKKHLVSLSVGGSYNVTASIKIPDHFEGSYYLYVVTDDKDNVFEHLQENNNSRRSIGEIQVVKPNLIPSLLTIPVIDSTGSALTITWKLSVSGPGNLAASSSLSSSIYISTSPVWHPDSVTKIKDFSAGNNNIPAGGFLNQTTDFTIPDGVPGPLYVWLNVNPSHTIEETDFSDNILRSQSTLSIVRPDLIVSSVTIPSNTISGDSAIISWSLKNNGNGIVNNKTWKDRIVMSSYPLYHPDSVQHIGYFNHQGVTLQANATLQTSKKYFIPHGFSGTYYFYVITDYDQQVYEKAGELNNVSPPSNQTSLVLGPWADLTITQTQVQDTATQGDLVPFTFHIKNQGLKSTSGTGFKDFIYVSAQPFWNSSAVTKLQQKNYSSDLLPDSGYTIQTVINVPLSWSEGFYYFYVFTDAENKIYEYTGEGDNIVRSDPIYIKAYPPIDLAVTAVTCPTTANSGNTINISWSVSNQGQGHTLASSWMDALWLSQDPVFSPQTDRFLGEKKRTSALTAGNSYTTSMPAVVPNGLSGTWYLLVITDRDDVHFDINRNNNISQPQAIAITLTPSPDLTFTDYTAPVSVNTGELVSFSWKVMNVGAGPTLSGGWTDRLYLSTDNVVDNNDVIIGSKAFSGNLSVGNFYADTVEFFIPNVPTGNYILIYKTDNNNVEYEHNAEQNNLLTAMLFVNQLPPADLKPINMAFPDTVFPGDMATFEWSDVNLGTNIASGHLQDNLYLSRDTVWTVADILLGSVTGSVNIQPLDTLKRNFSVAVPGLNPGPYYLVVRTNVQNTINEVEKTNNTGISLGTMFIDLPELPLEVLLYDTLFNLGEKHYKVIIPDTLHGESLMAILKGDSLHGVNELYLTYNNISSRVQYDYSHSHPYQANQDLLVPTLDTGTYYLMAYGFNSAAPYQEISMIADILEFDIRTVNHNKGGNTGPVTVLLEGAKFDSLMTIYLDSSGVMIPATQLQYIDLTRCLVTFNLAGASTGRYDLYAQNSAGDTVRLEKVFRVVPGESPRLGLNILSPANSRPNRISAFTIEFGNLGNVDLVNPVVKVESLAGAPLSLDPAGLSALLTELTLQLSLPGEPANVLRPGVSGSIIVYTKSSSPLGFLIYRIQ